MSDQKRPYKMKRPRRARGARRACGSPRAPSPCTAPSARPAPRSAPSPSTPGSAARPSTATFPTSGRCSAPARRTGPAEHPLTGPRPRGRRSATPTSASIPPSRELYAFYRAGRGDAREPAATTAPLVPLVDELMGAYRPVHGRRGRRSCSPGRGPAWHGPRRPARRAAIGHAHRVLDLAARSPAARASTTTPPPS